MPAPDWSHGAWISKRGSKVKHVAIVDRKMARVPWRPICNAHSNSDEIRQVGTRGGQVTDMVWWVDLNVASAWPGRSVCKNCIRVVDELNQMLSGTDTDRESITVTDLFEDEQSYVPEPTQEEA